MASLGDALLGALLGHSDAEKMFRYLILDCPIFVYLYIIEKETSLSYLSNLMVYISKAEI